ncbi:MAG: hypothetical protein CFH10_01519 [Alphaproteobacteria bacterium MarineAlpha4_Bin2]|nr:MAG: hypothetical protein CFH10_01519 [Alphaproteobacteria bacterium MarineAlpha4_Bin2]
MSGRVFFIVGCGVVIVLIGGGLRQAFGVFLYPVTIDLEMSRQFFGLVMAAQALLYGVSQPVAGLLADRYGSVRIMVAGALLYSIGLWWAGISHDSWEFMISLGVLVGLGLSGPTQVLVLGAVGKVVSNERRSIVFGTVIAAQSVGMFIFVPGGQQLIDAIGWRDTIFCFAVMIGLLSLIAIGLRGSNPIEGDGPAQSIADAILEARSHSGYILLTLGFFVCGFHVTFIGTHFVAFLIDEGLSGEFASYALGLIGLFNVVGAYIFGALGDRFSKKNLLTMIYAARAAVMALVLVIPISEISAIAFGVVFGILWLATVPLTSGIVAQIFGTRYFSMLFGVVMMGHQFGSFTGAWLAGLIFDETGSYDLMWVAASALGLLAAILHWPIREQPLARLAQNAA